MTVFGMHHQLGRSAEHDMNKMSVIGHISLNQILARPLATMVAKTASIVVGGGQ